MSPTSRNPRRSHQRKGIALLWVSLLALIFIAMVGLSLDTGLVYYTGEQLHAVSDAAALAGARYVRSSETLARDAAVNIASLNSAGGLAIQIDRNDANAADGDVVIGRFNRNTLVFTPTTDTPNAVRVAAERTSGSLTGSMPLIFARGFGVNNSDVSRDTIATMGAGMSAGLIVLDHTAPCAMRMDGGAHVSVQPVPPQTCEDGAGVFVNSSSSTAACINTNATIETTGMWINGGYDGSPSSVTEGTCGSTPGSDLIREDTGIVLPDPLAGLDEPSTTGMTDFSVTLYGGGALQVNSSDVVVADPGYYSKGIKQTGGTLTFKPGVYILGGSLSNNRQATGLDRTGGDFCARGVLIFVKGPYGSLNLEGNGACVITPIDTGMDEDPATYFCNSSYSYPSTPSNIADYADIAIFQSRSNPNQAKIAGGSGFLLLGTYYFPSNELKVTGNAFNGGVQLICNTLWVTGTGDIAINYDGRNPGAASSQVFIVE